MKEHRSRTPTPVGNRRVLILPDRFRVFEDANDIQQRMRQLQFQVASDQQAFQLHHFKHIS